MSYIEEKYNKKITETFKSLNTQEDKLIELFKEKSLTIVDDIAQICALTTKKVNLILKKYYPEIVKMEYKIQIKSTLKFYFDLIDKLTDFVRHCEQFDKIDDNYYDVFSKFLVDKNKLISGKYNDIVKRELTNFYDEKSRNALEKIISHKFQKESEYFTFGSLEAEIKKIAKISGADEVKIKNANQEAKNHLPNANSIIEFSIPNEESKAKVNNQIIEFLTSKNYDVKKIDNFILTSAKLLRDNEI